MSKTTGTSRICAIATTKVNRYPYYNNKTQNVSYEVTWYDQDSFQLNQDPNILIAVIDAKADRQVTVIAPNSQAATMKVKLCLQQ